MTNTSTNDGLEMSPTGTVSDSDDFGPSIPNGDLSQANGRIEKSPNQLDDQSNCNTDSDSGSFGPEIPTDDSYGQTSTENIQDRTTKKAKVLAHGDDSDFGPKYISAERKKVKKISCANYLENLPAVSLYELSHMHRNHITHVVVSNKNAYVITASLDGKIKFWIREPKTISFVKQYRAHSKAITDLCLSWDDRFAASVSMDESLKLFTVQQFDLTVMVKLDFTPFAAQFIHSPNDPAELIAVSTATAPYEICVLSPSSTGNKVLRRTANLHNDLTHILLFIPSRSMGISFDKSGSIELWNPKDFERPSDEARLSFTLKSETDLFDLQKKNTCAVSATCSPDGQLLGVMGLDMILRVFRLGSCKIFKKYEESIEMHKSALSDINQTVLHIDSLEFQRKEALEKELLHSEDAFWQTMCFDESSRIIIYPTIAGIKVIDLETNQLMRLYGKDEAGLRFLAIAVFQGKARESVNRFLKMAESSISLLNNKMNESIIAATAFKKHRAYFFTNAKVSEENYEYRDVYDEKAVKGEMNHIPGDSGASKSMNSGSLTANAIVLHTSVGDIALTIYSKETPKTAENFITHAKNGYYNQVIFHRVIKGFMIQTGDPEGTGRGGTSIWNGPFSDEFHKNLNHDKPYTVSMANSGPNTNGSQFFISTVPCPWLNNKHTVFGHVTSGFDIVKKVEQVQTNSDDKPLKDIRILSISIK